MRMLVTFTLIFFSQTSFSQVSDADLSTEIQENESAFLWPCHMKE